MKSIPMVAPNLPWPPTTGGDLLLVSFATALQREYELHLLCDYAAGQRTLGAAGRAWYETRFSIPALTRGLSALYRELIP